MGLPTFDAETEQRLAADLRTQVSEVSMQLVRDIRGDADGARERLTPAELETFLATPGRHRTQIAVDVLTREGFVERMDAWLRDAQAKCL